MTDDLAARLRRMANECRLIGDIHGAVLFDEAADALEAKDAECSQALTEQRRRLCAEHDKDRAELKRVRQVAKDEIAAAEARVRELEAERDKWDRRVAYDELQAREHENRATQQHQIDALTIRAEAAERALAEAYERCAKVAETEGAYPELNVWAGGPEWYRRGLRIAAAIRKLAQEVKS